MAKKKNIIEDIYFMMQGVNADALFPTLEQLTDMELTDRDGRTVLINAAFCGRLDVVEFCAARGANINAADKNGFTALHAAVQEKHIEIIKFLLAHGADVNAQNAFGNNPVFILTPQFPMEVFEILLANGADPHMKNLYGMSAADKWAMANYPEILKKYI